jgi:hypothetical protein
LAAGAEVNVGTWSAGTTNDKLFNLTITDKNASSSNYDLPVVDYIRLTK